MEPYSTREGEEDKERKRGKDQSPLHFMSGDNEEWVCVMQRYTHACGLISFQIDNLLAPYINSLNSLKEWRVERWGGRGEMGRGGKGGLGRVNTKSLQNVRCDHTLQ